MSSVIGPGGSGGGRRASHVVLDGLEIRVAHRLLPTAAAQHVLGGPVDPAAQPGADAAVALVDRRAAPEHAQHQLLAQLVRVEPEVMGRAPHTDAQPLALDLQQPLDPLRGGVGLRDRSPVPAQDVARVGRVGIPQRPSERWQVTRTTSEIDAPCSTRPGRGSCDSCAPAHSRPGIAGSRGRRTVVSSLSRYGRGVRRCDTGAGHVRRERPVPLPERFEGNRPPAEVAMNSLPANFPEISILLALLLTVVFWNVVRLRPGRARRRVRPARHGRHGRLRRGRAAHVVRESVSPPALGALRYGVPDTEEC